MGKKKDIKRMKKRLNMYKWDYGWDVRPSWWRRQRNV